MAGITFTVETQEALYMLKAAELICGPVGISAILKGMIVEYLQRQTADRFAQQGSKVTGPWAELNPLTQQYRLMQGFNPTWPINVRFGDMRAWLEQDRGSLISSSSVTEMTWPGEAAADNETKFVAAQEGKDDSGRTFPARPVVEFTTQDAAEVLVLMETSIRAAFTAAGTGGFSAIGGDIIGGAMTSNKGFGGGSPGGGMVT